MYIIKFRNKMLYLHFKYISISIEVLHKYNIIVLYVYICAHVLLLYSNINFFAFISIIIFIIYNNILNKFIAKSIL